MNERYNIGILVANIMDSFSNRVSKGAIAAAEAFDANLFIFPMKYLDVDYGNTMLDMKFEYQYNILMDYAAKAKLDHLIVCTGTRHISAMMCAKRKCWIISAALLC